MAKFNPGDRVFIDSRGSKSVKATVSKVLNGGVTVVIDGTNGFYTINNSYVSKRRSIVGKTFENVEGNQKFTILKRQNGIKDWVLGPKGWIKNKYEASYENTMAPGVIQKVWIKYYTIRHKLKEV